MNNLAPSLRSRLDIETLALCLDENIDYPLVTSLPLGTNMPVEEPWSDLILSICRAP